MSVKKLYKEFEQGRLLPVVEEFYSLQGEGYHMGKASYFLRIGGCDVGCSWCDSKQSWNPEIHPAKEIDEVIQRIIQCPAKTVVVTGGEPLMFNLDYLCGKVKEGGVSTMVETSGTHPFSGSWEWICLSPKKQSGVKKEYFAIANELKIIVADESDFQWAEENAQRVTTGCQLYLQPEWSASRKTIPLITAYIQKNPKWKISLQAHKYMKIP